MRKKAKFKFQDKEYDATGILAVNQIDEYTVELRYPGRVVVLVGTTSSSILKKIETALTSVVQDIGDVVDDLGSNLFPKD